MVSAMSLGVDIDEVAREVVVRLHGLDSWMALTSTEHLPFETITGARVVPVSELTSGRGWRLGGTYWPGGICAGRYGVPGRSGARQLWLVFRDPEVLVIDTTLERPTRVVLQTPDRDELARRINEVKRGPTDPAMGERHDA